MSYLPFVIAAYAIAGAALAVMIGWVFLERRAAKQALARAERAAEQVGAPRRG